MENNSLHQFHQYILTTDIYKADLPVHAPKELTPLLAEMYNKVIKKDKSVIVKLLHSIEKYPDVPQLKNFLSLYYSLSGNNDKAHEINAVLLEDFPDYLYARLNMANSYIHDDEPEKVPEVLGTSIELKDLYPERKIFHHEEYLNFYKTAAAYYCVINQPDIAQTILDNLNKVCDLLDIDTDFEKLENSIMFSKFRNLDERMFEKNDGKKTLKEKPTLPQIKKPPVFHYPQISWLYQYSIAGISPEKINELLSLEKEWLRIDLETVIYDSIRRYDFFKKQGLNDDETYFPLHALYLLKEINAEESLPAVLELLRQPEDLLDHWLGDTLSENLWQVVYTLGFNQVNKLGEFLKEPLNYVFARSTVSSALSQMTLHHHEKRDTIIATFKDVTDFFIRNKTNTTIADDTMIGLMIGDIIEFNGKELIPEIKALFAEDLVDESVIDDLDGILNELDEIPEGEFNEAFKKPLQNYFEIKAELASWAANDDYDEEDTDDHYDDWEEVEADDDNTQYFYTGDKPFIRATPKVGRNEPCPCGSGKKYKNCHGIDA